MSRSMLAALLVGAAACDGDFAVGVSEPGFGVDEPMLCEVDANARIVRLDLDRRTDSVRFSHTCPDGADLTWRTDDPSNGFGITAPNLDAVGAGEPWNVEVELLASEPGVYEAQLTVEAPDYGLSHTIELFGEIE